MPSRVHLQWLPFLFIGSPLIVVLRALVHLDSVDRNKIDSSNTLSFLLGIFRAIKKAEDAVDVEITPVCDIYSLVR